MIFAIILFKMKKNKEELAKIGLMPQIVKNYLSSKEFVEEMGKLISEKGFFLQTKREIDKGSFIQFNFTLNNDKHILKGIGQITFIRENPAGWGVKFVEIDERSQKNIQMILEWKNQNK